MEEWNAAVKNSREELATAGCRAAFIHPRIYYVEAVGAGPLAGTSEGNDKGRNLAMREGQGEEAREIDTVENHRTVAQWPLEWNEGPRKDSRNARGVHQGISRAEKPDPFLLRRLSFSRAPGRVTRLSDNVASRGDTCDTCDGTRNASNRFESTYVRQPSGNYID